MSKDNLDFNKYLQNSSTRHHYIPRFLISAFSNADGFLYVYDKTKDQIFEQPRSPKSIFFENDRNTINLNASIKTSIIEDLLYQGIDDQTSKIIKRYQEASLSEIVFNTDDTANMLFFLISLFWRIPLTDYAAHDLLERSTITFAGGDPEALRRDPAYQKIARAGIFKHHIAELKAFGSKGTKRINIHQHEMPIYVIGDNPIVFKKTPHEFREFNNTDILIAISSNRIYSSTVDSLGSLNTIKSMQYNACVIHGSVRYIACGDMKILEQSVSFYKKLSEMGLIYGLERQIFTTV